MSVLGVGVTTNDAVKTWGDVQSNQVQRYPDAVCSAQQKYRDLECKYREIASADDDKLDLAALKVTEDAMVAANKEIIELISAWYGGEIFYPRSYVDSLLHLVLRRYTGAQDAKVEAPAREIAKELAYFLGMDHHTGEGWIRSSEILNAFETVFVDLANGGLSLDTPVSVGHMLNDVRKSLGIFDA